MSSLRYISGEMVWLVKGDSEFVLVLILCGGIVWRRGRGEGLLLGSCIFLLRPFFCIRRGMGDLVEFFFLRGLEQWQT